MTSHQLRPVPDTSRAVTITTRVISTDSNGAVTPSPASTSAAIVLTGRLDAVEAPKVRGELTRVQLAGAGLIVVDLADVTFIDSAGLAALIRGRREAQRLGGDVILISPSDRSALRVFQLTQFDEVFRMVSSRSDA